MFLCFLSCSAPDTNCDINNKQLNLDMLQSCKYITNKHLEKVVVMVIIILLFV